MTRRRLGGNRPDLYAANAAEIALGQGRLADASRLFHETLSLAKDKPSMQWSVYEGLGRTAIAAKKPGRGRTALSNDARRHRADAL